MADNELLRLEAIHKQASTVFRAAEAQQKAARSSHLQRLAEREVAHSQEDYCRGQLRLHGKRVDLETGLRDAEFACKMAGQRAKASAAVAAQSDIKHNEASNAVIAAKVNIDVERDDPAANMKRSTSESTRSTMDGSPLSSCDRNQGPSKTLRGAEQSPRQGGQAQTHREEEERKQREAHDKHETEWKRQFHTAQERLERRFSGLAVGPSFSQRVWKREVEQALKDLTVVKVFPELPLSKCTKPACLTGRSQRVLKACVCDVESAFTLLELPLKEARNAWHPDRWSKCPEEHRESFQSKAKEVFQVVMKMLEKEKA